MKTSFNNLDEIKRSVRMLSKSNRDEQPEEVLLHAVMLFLREEVNVRFQTFASVEKILRLGSIDDCRSSEKSPLDELFDALQKKQPNCMAVKRYRTFKMLPIDDQRRAYFIALCRVQKALEEDNYS